jgi:hypothetical protein
LEANVQVEPSSSEDEGPVITQGPAMGPPQTPESLYCAICHGTPVAGTRTKYDVLPCLHKFHTVCLSKWLKKNRFCPICKVSCDGMIGNVLIEAGDAPADVNLRRELARHFQSSGVQGLPASGSSAMPGGMTMPAMLIPAGPVLPPGLCPPVATIGEPTKIRLQCCCVWAPFRCTKKVFIMCKSLCGFKLSSHV